MNNARRKSLKEAIKLLKEAQDLLVQAQDIIQEEKDGEQETFDNLPENLQGSDRASKYEENINYLEDANDMIDSADIESIITNLEEAIG